MPFPWYDAKVAAMQHGRHGRTNTLAVKFTDCWSLEIISVHSANERGRRANKKPLSPPQASCNTTFAAWEGRRPPKCEKRSCALVNAKALENRKSPLDRTVKSCEGAFGFIALCEGGRASAHEHLLRWRFPVGAAQARPFTLARAASIGFCTGGAAAACAEPHRRAARSKP